MWRVGYGNPHAFSIHCNSVNESFSVLAQFTNTTAVFTGSPAVVTVINEDDDDDGTYV